MEEIKCAIYTRKSTDEGLEKEFNTLEAQREAGENYILSQKHQGWRLIDEHYDDGGFSGGNMKRPALQRLLEDIKNGKVTLFFLYGNEQVHVGNGSRCCCGFQKNASAYVRGIVHLCSPFMLRI